MKREITSDECFSFDSCIQSDTYYLHSCFALEAKVVSRYCLFFLSYMSIWAFSKKPLAKVWVAKVPYRERVHILSLPIICIELLELWILCLLAHSLCRSQNTWNVRDCPVAICYLATINYDFLSVCLQHDIFYTSTD